MKKIVIAFMKQLNKNVKKSARQRKTNSVWHYLRMGAKKKTEKEYK